jgi:hypothetical protein
MKNLEQSTYDRIKRDVTEYPGPRALALLEAYEAAIKLLDEAVNIGLTPSLEARAGAFLYTDNGDPRVSFTDENHNEVPCRPSRVGVGFEDA